MLKRRLVLTHEAARHPFRQRLPRPLKAAAKARGDDQDVRLFVLSFAAFFTTFYSFLI